LYTKEGLLNINSTTLVEEVFQLNKPGILDRLLLFVEGDVRLIRLDLG